MNNRFFQAEVNIKSIKLGCKDKGERTKMKNEEFENESIGKLLIKFSVPAMVGLLVTALYNIVDRFFIGKMPGVGAQALSGVSVTFSISLIIMAFGMLVGTGAASRISISLGKGDRKETSKILGNAFLLNTIISLTLSIIGLLFYKPILIAFGATPEIMTYASEYIFIVIGGIFFTNTAYAMNNVIRAQGFPTISMVTLLIGAAVNIVLDPIFIFGLDMGVKGAAWATITAQTVSTIWTLYYLTGKKITVPLKFKDIKFDIDIAKSIFSIGMAPFAMQLAGAMVEVLFNRTFNIYTGAIGIGVFSTINSLILLFLMPVVGINQGAQPLIGYFFGSNNFKRLKETYVKAILAGTALSFVGFAAFQLAPSFMLGIFNKDPEFLTLGIPGMRILTAMMPILGFQMISSNFFQAIGEASTAMFLSVSRQVIVLVPLIYIMPKLFGVTGVWAAQPVSDFISTLITTFFIIRIFKQINAEEKGIKLNN